MVQPGPNTGPITPPHPWGPGREERDRKTNTERETETDRQTYTHRQRETETQGQKETQRNRHTKKEPRRRGSSPGTPKERDEQKDSQSHYRARRPSEGPAEHRAGSRGLTGAGQRHPSAHSLGRTGHEQRRGPLGAPVPREHSKPPRCGPYPPAHVPHSPATQDPLRERAF